MLIQVTNADIAAGAPKKRCPVEIAIKRQTGRDVLVGPVSVLIRSRDRSLFGDGVAALPPDATEWWWGYHHRAAVPKPIKFFLADEGFLDLPKMEPRPVHRKKKAARW